LDTISRLVERREDSADTWRNLYNYTMVPLRRQGRTVLRLDHQGHDSSKGARGSSAKRDDVDVAWIMKRKGNEVTLIRDKGRGLGHPKKMMLRRHPAPHATSPASTAVSTVSASRRWRGSTSRSIQAAMRPQASCVPTATSFVTTPSVPRSRTAARPRPTGRQVAGTDKNLR